MSNSASEATNAGEFFDKLSDQYERFTGGCTHDIALFLLSLPPKVDSSSVVLDNACGTGIITKELLNDFPESAGGRPKIHAADISPSMVSKLTDVAKEKGWMNGSDGLVEASAMDAQELTFQDNMFTHSYTNFGIFFAPDPVKCARHIYRTLKPGGVAFVTSWEKLGYLPLIQAAQKEVRPDEKPWTFPHFDEEWFREEKLRSVLEAGGFESSRVKIQRKSAAYRGENVDDLIDLMKMVFAGQVTKEWSENEKEKFIVKLRENLTEKQKAEASLEMEAFVAVAEK